MSIETTFLIFSTVLAGIFSYIVFKLERIERKQDLASEMVIEHSTDIKELKRRVRFLENAKEVIEKQLTVIKTKIETKNNKT